MTEEQNLVDCLLFEDRLNDLIDSRLDLADDPGLIQHVQQCAVCTRLLKDYQQLMELRPMSKDCEGELDVSITRNRCGPLPFGQRSGLTLQARRTKLKWAISLAPSFAALFIVSISMILVSGNPEGISGLDSHWDAAGLQKVVAQGGSLVNERSLARSTYPYDPIVDSVFIRSGIVDGVQGYSNAIYQLANAQSHLQSCDWQREVVDKVALPYAPIHHQIPYRGEFSAIPQFRFFLGFAIRLIEMTFSDVLELSNPDLGLQTECWNKLARA